MKLCPVCRLQAPFDAVQCVQCGHNYQTIVMQAQPQAATNTPPSHVAHPAPYLQPQPQQAYGCPRCGSAHMQTITNTQTTSNGFSGCLLISIGMTLGFIGICFWPLMLGGVALIIIGIVQAVSGSGGSTSTTVTVCGNCGLRV